ncbi:MAG: O-antigen ligase family protein [Pirellulaceae bacterium]
MGARSRRKQEQVEASQAPSWLGPLLTGGIALGVVATPLVGSEGFPHRGAELPLALGWLLLLMLWGIQAIGQKKLEIRWSLVETLLLAFLAWLALSTWFVFGKGAPRPAFNSLWDYIHLVISFFLIRQVITHPRQVRAMVVVMVAVAAAISAYSLYQNLVEFPQMRRDYYANPEEKLRESGIDPTPGNPTRVLFESRLDSTEVTGTFTLANSFSAFLVPWFLLAIGWVYLEVKNRRASSVALAGCLAVVLMAVCLWLAESRASWISVTFGLGLMLVYGTAVGRNISWKLATAVFGMPLVLAILGFALGVLDVAMLGSAPTSLLYRLQYWEGSAQIISKYPLVGCGLANFQRVYPEFMLPMASETVADPHNFVFEIWAGTGTPAILLLLATMVVWALKVGRTPAAETPASVETPATDDPAPSAANSPTGDWSDVLPILIGGGLALALTGFLRMFTQQESVNLAIVLLGVVPLGLVIWLVRGWIERGSLPTAWLVIAVVSLTVNLTAAGGISFPGVAGSWYLLAALALPVAQQHVFQQSWARLLPAGLALGLIIVWNSWAYSPTIGSRSEVAVAHEMVMRGNFPAAVDFAQTAAQLDPWDDQPDRLLAEIYYQTWMARPEESTRQKFDAAIARAAKRVPLNYQSHFRLGQWRLGFYRRGDDPKDLELAIENFRQAVELFPSRAIHHAQLAWALHLAGQDGEASQAADQAARLDEVNPHSERKLERLKIEDVRWPNRPKHQVEPPAAEVSAKQIVDLLRTMED